MKNKKKIIVAIISLVVVLAIVATFIVLHDKNRSVNEKNVNQVQQVTPTDDETVNDETTLNTDDSQSKHTTDSIQNEKKVDNSQNNNSKQSVDNTKKSTNNSNGTTNNKRTTNGKAGTSGKTNNDSNNTPKPSTPAAPTPTYSCPSGYSLSGTQCKKIVEATLTCPSGKHEFSDGNVSGCVVLSEAYQSADGSCPSGYGKITMMSIGGPDTLNCIPVYSKVYVCPDGYSLSNASCISVIPATAN